jgi:hypothetical protein
MKTLLKLTLAFLTASSALAEEAHQHGKVVAGPNGGRIIEVAGTHAEFFVQPDRKAKVAFYSEDMKPLPPGDQLISAVAEAPAGKAKLEFDKTTEGFVSRTALPEGEGYRIVLQIKPAADAKAQNFRIDYESKLCGECKMAEYACVCAHG